MEITTANPKISASFEVSLPHDLCTSLALSQTAQYLDSLSDWLRTIPPNPAAHQFVALTRYCPGLWAKLTQFPADHPARTSFDEFKASLEARPADDYVLLAQMSLKERLNAWDETPPASLTEQFKAAQTARRARYGDPAVPDLPPETLTGLLTPELKPFLINLFTQFWGEHYKERWELDRPRIEAAVRFHKHQQYSANFASLFIAATGRAMPDSIRDALHGVSRAVFIPSCHIGPYFIVAVALPVIAISFNALTVDATSHARPEVVEVFAPLKALADETRLQVLALMTDGKERYAQEIMAELGISQSAASRHLALLESTGLLAVRKEGTSKFYSLNETKSLKFIDSLRKLLIS